MRVITCIVGIMFLCSVPTLSVAAPPEEDLKEYLRNLEWTTDDLKSYLTTKNLTLEQFDTMEDLIDVLGTPINESNIQHLLQDYNLTHDDLDDLLEQFGESTEDYTFIEDLELAISFFQRHNDELNSITDFLSYIGMTEDEISGLLDHIVSLDQKKFLSKIEMIDKRIENFGEIDELGNLQDEKQKELLSILDDVFTAYELTPSFFVTGEIDGFPQTVQLKKLTEMEPANGKVIEVSLQSNSGSALANITLSSEMLHSDFVLQASEQFVNVGQLATTMGSLMNGDPLPVTATSHPFKISVGLCLLVLSSILMYLASKEQMRKQ